MILDLVDGFAGRGQGAAELEEELLQRHIVYRHGWWVAPVRFSHDPP
jgi:hypothetical protein